MLTFGKSISQDNIVITERNCLDDSCNRIKKFQYTFNQKGQIKEYIIFGDYHNADTNFVANTTKFRYEKSKILERKNYNGKYLDFKINYSYSNGRLSAVKYKNCTTKYYYNNNGKVSFTIMIEDLDTLRTIKYTYKKNKLIEIFKYNNKIEYDRTTYSKSNDTIIETLTRYDSIHVEKPLKIITKNKYNGSKILYSFCFYEDDKSSEENTISYDSFGNVIEINQNSKNINLNKKEKSKLSYKNGLIDKIEDFEFIDNNWIPKKIIDYDVQKSNKMPKNKVKKQINSYLIQRLLTF